MVRLPAKTLKVCPRQLEEALSLQSGPECRINAPRLSGLPASLRPFSLGHPPSPTPPTLHVCIIHRQRLHRCTCNEHICAADMAVLASASLPLRCGRCGEVTSFLPTVPLCHSNVRSSWVTPPPPPPLPHPSLCTLCRRFSEWPVLSVRIAPLRWQTCAALPLDFPGDGTLLTLRREFQFVR